LKNCPKCEASIPGDAKFCRKCGTAQQQPMKKTLWHDSPEKVNSTVSTLQTDALEAGKEYEVDIVERDPDGDGLAKIMGVTVFVPRTKVGERVRIRLIQVSGRFAWAKRAKPTNVWQRLAIFSKREKGQPDKPTTIEAYCPFCKEKKDVPD